MIYMAARRLPPDTNGPIYYVEASDGMLRLAHESQLAPARLRPRCVSNQVPAARQDCGHS
jgi:hypothetical protein